MSKPKTKSPQLQAHYKVWLSSKNGEGILGDGKWFLLQEVERCNSISKASESIGISYRKAWGDIRKAEEMLGVSLLERQRGGETGGTSELTEVGRKIVKTYSKFHKKIDKDISKDLDKFLNELKEILR